MGKAKKGGKAANTSHRNAVKAQKDPVKALAQAIKNHIAVSQHDRTPDDAIRRLVGQGLLTLDGEFYEHFAGRSIKVSSRCKAYLNELGFADERTLRAMFYAYADLVEKRPVFHDSLGEVAATFNCCKTGLRSKYAPSTDAFAEATQEPMDIKPALDQFRASVSSGSPFTMYGTGCGPDSKLLRFMRALYAAAPDLGPWMIIDFVEEDIDLLRAAAVQITVSARTHFANLRALYLTHGNIARCYDKGATPEFESVSTNTWSVVDLREKEEVTHD